VALPPGWHSEHCGALWTTWHWYRGGDGGGGGPIGVGETGAGDGVGGGGGWVTQLVWQSANVL
jgi:hypothetical protein